jgi:hypothetical protein
MLVNRHREKLINAMKYFIANTRYCHTLKLFKLLNFLDFEHYRQTGSTVTGLTYRALPKGPVPTELFAELRKGPKPDLAHEIEIKQVVDEADAVLRRELKNLRPFDSKHFSKREMKIMNRLVEFFKEVQAEDMSRVSHARKMPWGQVFQNGKGVGKEIPYELAITSDPLMPDVAGLDNDEINARKELFAHLNGPF